MNATKTLTFVFFPQGQDNNGNGGPTKDSAGRVEVTVPDTDDGFKDTYNAFKLLPQTAKDLIQKTLRKQHPRKLREHLEEGCGWGDPFFFGCKEWDELENIDG